MKAISVIVVVFYHIEWLKTSYLGVDIFFVMKSMFKDMLFLLLRRNRKYRIMCGVI
ncbi:hypothetical protein M116_0801 [Bacteroides fragilis str. 3719 A10]|nr:hypothetical protein M116_0801 [Bacteroides fragilis str. 3719 A10]